MAKLIQVIETEVLRGDGTEASVMRLVKQYFSPEGVLLAESDPLSNLEQFKQQLIAVIEAEEKSSTSPDGVGLFVVRERLDNIRSAMGLPRSINENWVR